MSETDKFLNKLLSEGKITQADIDDFNARKNKKDVTLTGKTISSLNTVEQRRLLELVAIQVGVANINGVIT